LVNAVPIFVDVDPRTFTMDPAKIAERITSRTRAILAASLYGQPADYDAIMDVARRHGLLVIDDACQSVGAAIGDRKLGVVADITAFSFSGKPIVSSSGGMVTTNLRPFYERSLLGGQHPSFISTEAESEEIWRFASTGGYGHNLRMDGHCAARAYEQLERLDLVNNARRANAHHLTGRLRDNPCITVPVERAGAHHVFHMYTGLFDGAAMDVSRDEFVDAVNAEGVWTLAYVSSGNFLKTTSGGPFDAGPLHRRHLFQELARHGSCGPFRFPDGVRPDYSAGSLPVTERLGGVEFNIPQRYLNPPFTRHTMDQYADAIEKVLDNAAEIRDARRRTEGATRRHHFVVASQSD
jgi:dTDP-4-amino-4,6-dideoxygalactose transaminase